jgi:hypothetical protein
MLNVTIQNDGKIKFQSECSSTKELLSQSPDESFINTMKDTLESAGCICRITNGF